jgi:hypothetical protein
MNAVAQAAQEKHPAITTMPLPSLSAPAFSPE